MSLNSCDYWFGPYLHHKHVPNHPCPPPPPTFPRADWDDRNSVHRLPPFNPRYDMYHLIKWAARGASIQWASIVSASSHTGTELAPTPSELTVTPGFGTPPFTVSLPATATVAGEMFILAVIDKILEVNHWMRLMRHAHRAIPQTIREWREEVDCLVPVVYELALQSFPCSEDAPPLDDITWILHALLVHSYKHDADAREGRMVSLFPLFDHDIIYVCLPTIHDIPIRDLPPDAHHNVFFDLAAWEAKERKMHEKQRQMRLNAAECMATRREIIKTQLWRKFEKEAAVVEAARLAEKTARRRRLLVPKLAAGQVLDVFV